MQQYTYLNTAGCGLLSQSSQQVLQEGIQQYANHGSLAREVWFEELSFLRQRAAELIGASETEVALITNFTNGVYQVAHLLREHAEKVLLIDDDYPSLTLPWHLLGYEVHSTPVHSNGSISPETIEDSIRQHQIKILAVSHVQYSSGFQLSLAELGEICRRNDTLLVVDATQSLGMIPISLRDTPVDVLIASGYKWLNSGLGNGLLYLREDLYAQLRPNLLGFGAVGSNYTPESLQELPFTPQTLEAGHYNFFSLLVLRQAIEDSLQIGIANINHRVMQLRQQLTEGLPGNISLVSDYPSTQASGIVVVKAPADAEQQLRAQNIITATRPKGLRISPHFFNDEGDIQQVCQALGELQ